METLYTIAANEYAEMCNGGSGGSGIIQQSFIAGANWVTTSKGGARPGAGRKPKFKGEEKTTTIAFRVPVSKTQEIKEKIDKILEKYLPENLK